ncbi:MAG: VWA domain-containing protein [Myxococcales bacterium FL481]|nr:MAG: VWA domain-containing protein [Myxococcales bacterium FL481]
MSQPSMAARATARMPAWLSGLIVLVASVGLAGAAYQWLGPSPPWHVPAPALLTAFMNASSTAQVRFAQPHLAWLIPAGTVPFLVWMATRSLVDQRNRQIATNTVLRALVLASLGLAVAWPSLLTPMRGKTVVFVVDTSASVSPEALARVRQLVRQAQRLSEEEIEDGVDPQDRTRIRLVTYAESARAYDLHADPPQDLHIHPSATPLASHHAEALALAHAVVDPDTEPVFVLCTDGAGDRRERQALAASLAELEQRDVTIRFESLEPAAKEDVAITGMHLPNTLRIGQTIDLIVDIESSATASASLRVTQNGQPNELMPAIDVQLRAGENQVRVPARLLAAGPVLFRAELDPSSIRGVANDRPDNDHGATAGEIRGRPRVLHVGSDGSQALVRALRADHLDVDDRSAASLPTETAALAGYDLVVFSDIPARAVSTDQQRAIVEYVREQGGGFAMVGGEHAFGVGGWKNTPIESILPVRFEGERQREEPTLALMLVIDKSGSMSSQDKLDLVKEAARLTARTLDPADEIGVIAFDSRAHVLVRLQRAANRIRISSDIARLTAGGGTNVLPALREAYLQLSGSRALVKHVILLSDGQSPERGIASLLHDMRSSDITVSTVGVGEGAGKELLSRIASQGRGRYYFSQDGTDVPRIFSRETREVSRNAVVEQQHFARVHKSVQALRGIDFGRAPGLAGLIPIDAKPRTETLLRTQNGDDLLVRGRSGLGRTLAFASDAKPRWASRWLLWSGFPKLWSQLARDTMRQGKASVGGASIEIQPGERPGAFEAVVDVDAVSGFANGLHGELEIVDLSREADDAMHRRAVPLRLTAPGRYVARLHGIEAGQRLFRARLFDRSVEPARLAAQAVTQLSIPYPAELLPGPIELARAMPLALEPLADVEALVKRPGQASGRTKDTPLWPMVLWGLTLPLFVLDLALRRITWGRRRVTV